MLKQSWQGFKAIAKEAMRQGQVNTRNRWVMSTVVNNLSAKLNGSDEDCRKEGVYCSFTQKLSWGGFGAKEDLCFAFLNWALRSS